MLPILLNLLSMCATIFAKNHLHKVLAAPVNVSVLDMEPCLLGEGPHWDEEAQALYLVDVIGQNVHCLDYATGILSTKHIEYGQVNVVVPVVGSTRLLVAVRAELFLLDWAAPGDRGLRLLAPVDLGRPNNVLNDGRADANGRFWGGTKGTQHGDAVASDEGSFFSLSQERFTRPELHLKPVSISNGVVWALNNSVLYYVDSPTFRVDAFDFDLEAGRISNRRQIIDVRDYGYTGIPDGMTIDKYGHLWVAIMFNGTILQVSPDERRAVGAVRVPASRSTACAWGGPRMDRLFVSSARANMSPAQLAREPLAGRTFVVRGLGARGVPLHKFRFDRADDY